MEQEKKGAAPPDPDMTVSSDTLKDDLDRLTGLIVKAHNLVEQQKRSGATKLLDMLAMALERAGRSADNARRQHVEGRRGDAIAETMALIDAVKNGVIGRDNLDELDRELAEGGTRKARSAGWVQLSALLEEIDAALAVLQETAIAYSHELDTKAGRSAAGRSQSTEADMEKSDGTAEAVREVGITLATMLGGTAGIGSPAARRYAAVPDQMIASLDTYGLPHEGVLLGSGDEEVARRRLIEGLKRNFASRETDGYRTYYRANPQPVTRDLYDRSRLLRGSALVSANLLRAEADAILGIIDRLPSMARFDLAVPYRGAVRDCRDGIRAHLDNLVDCARDPMGLNRRRVRYEYYRLLLAIFDYLDEAEILQRAYPSDLGAETPLRDAMAKLKDLRDEVCAPSSLVRDEEVRAELANLFDLLISVARRLLSDRVGEQRGLQAARLEESMTAIFASAEQLEMDLERSGTDLLEQDIQFPDARESLSIGQLIRWARSIALPFLDADNRAASLRQRQCEILAAELTALHCSTKSFAAAAGRLGLSRPGPRMQLNELAGYVESAAQHARGLAGMSELGREQPGAEKPSREEPTTAA